jgi:hypothetical protein
MVAAVLREAIKDTPCTTKEIDNKSNLMNI